MAGRSERGRRGVVVGSVQHAYRRVHIAGGHSFTPFEPLPQACQRFLGGEHRIRVAADRHTVAAAGEPHPKTLFQPHQVPVVVAEQKRQQGVIVEIQRGLAGWGRG